MLTSAAGAGWVAGRRLRSFRGAAVAPDTPSGRTGRELQERRTDNGRTYPQPFAVLNGFRMTALRRAFATAYRPLAEMRPFRHEKRDSQRQWIGYLRVAQQCRAGRIIAVTSSRQPVLVIRPRAVVEDRVQSGEVAGIRIEPSIDMLRLDRNDAAVMTGCCNLRGRFVGDGRK